MSTLHGDFRIISNCSSYFGPLTEKSLPLASVYYPNEQRSNYWEEKVVNGSFRIVQYPDVGDVVCYLGCLPFVEGVVDESAKVDVKGDLHTIFDRQEYGREVIFLRKKPEPLLGGSD